MYFPIRWVRLDWNLCGLLKLLLILSFFQILDEIEEHNIKIYHLPDAESDEDEDFKEQTRLLKVRIPGAQRY